MLSFITDTQLVEGAFAASVWAIFWVYMRNRLKLPVYVEGAMAWLLVWFVRKFGLTLYKSIKLANNWPSFKVQISPIPKIIIDKSEQI
jgi:hypothetical protein